MTDTLAPTVPGLQRQPLTGRPERGGTSVSPTAAQGPTAQSPTAQGPTAQGPEGALSGFAYVRTVMVLGLIIALGPLTIDMYLPALPAVADDLGATEPQVQFTLTGIMIGLAFGQLLLGPVTDAIGRRRPILVGLAVHAGASVACALAASVGMLSAVRVIQGVAGAAVSVSVMAMVRDRFTGRAAAGVLSHLMLVIGVAPVLAPSLGGWLLAHTDWRGIFAVLAVAALALLGLSLVALRESLPTERRRSARPVETVRTYVGLLADRPFVGLVLTMGLVMGVLFTYVAGSSFVLQGVYGLDQQQFGLVFGANAMGLVLASQTNPLLLRRFSPQQVLTAAVIAATVASALLLAAALVSAPLPFLLVPLGVAVAMSGYAFPNAPALALSRHGESAGTAAAVLGAVQFGTAGLVSPLVGVFGTASAVPLAGVMLGSAALAAVVLLVVVRPWELPALDD